MHHHNLSMKMLSIIFLKIDLIMHNLVIIRLVFLLININIVFYIKKIGILLFKVLHKAFYKPIYYLPLNMKILLACIFIEINILT